ncbi:MAG TPA: SPOR domain-containing protein [Casimicrobiaceae bacterium]|nr:SPOR domain-containing protein [Casimicrobiaceae bacterium]
MTGRGMRALVVVLVVANVLLFAYGRLERSAQSEGGRLAMQVEPERIRPMTPQEVAALAPTKVAATTSTAPTTCVEWGPFADADRARAEADLQPLALGRLVSLRPVVSDASTYWVNVGGLATRSAAERRAAELRAQAIADLSVVEYPRGQFTVSLGVFRSEAAANARAETLAARGVAGTQVEPRGQANGQSMIVVRDAREPIVARLRELQAQYAGTDVKVAACPPS